MWVTSDLHFYHYNVLKFCPETRPYKTIEEMNESLISEWNNKVSKNKTKVFHLGDFCFGTEDQTREIVSQLNGDITFIIGNHDRSEKNKILAEFGKVCHYEKVNYQNKKFILFHYPILEWDSKHHGSIHLYGHLHGNKIPESKGMGKSMDVGFDAIGKIIHFDEIIEIMKEKSIGFCSHLGE